RYFASLETLFFNSNLVAARNETRNFVVPLIIGSSGSLTKGASYFYCGARDHATIRVDNVARNRPGGQSVLRKRCRSGQRDAKVQPDTISLVIYLALLCQAPAGTKNPKNWEVSIIHNQV